MSSKKIACIGLVAFIGIIGSLTAAFNWFWSKLGTDSTSHMLLPFTTNFNDFKEYATLYIPLISFGATLFAGFVVFLVFNDWKAQHNQSVDSKYYSQALENFKNISSTVRKFKILYEKCNYINTNNHSSDIEFFKEKYIEIKNELIQNLDIFQNDLIFLQNLNKNNSEITTIESIFINYINKSKQKLTDQDISLKYYNNMTNYEELEKNLKDISTTQGKLILDNIESIVYFLNSKIKVI